MSIKEVEGVVDVVVRKTARKVAGLYYMLWASFAPAVLLGHPLTYISNTAAVVFIVLLTAVYLAATWRLIGGAYKMRREKLSVSAASVYLAVFALLASAFFLAGAYWRLFMLAAAAVIVFGAYTFLKTSGAGVYWYDHVALLTLPPVFAVAPEYFPLWSVMTLVWIYAGVKSLVDVVER